MKSCLTTVVLFYLCSLVCLGGINLTPSEVIVNSDGSKFKRVGFKHESGYFIYAPPDGWSYTGTPKSFTARSLDANPASASIESLPLTQPFVLNEDKMKRAATEIIESLPKGCDKVALVSQTANQIRVDGNDSLETIVTYVVYGRSMEMSVLDVNFGSEILRFKLVSDKPVFSKAHDLFCSSLKTWGEPQQPPQPAS